MTAGFSNVYDDSARAEAYAQLDFPGTYFLAFRDLPAIIGEHVRGTKALDFGCGAGRSTRFLRRMGFDAVGVDVSESMLSHARARDPEGAYHLVRDDDFGEAGADRYDLVLSAFTFDNVPTRDKKVALLSSLGRLLKSHGRLVNLVSSPEIYLHEWASFSTRDFPENRTARSGDRVRIVMLDVEDRRPVEDVLCTDEDYLDAYQRAHLDLLATHRPLAKPEEAFAWVNETTISPWVIYVLRHSSQY